MVLEKYFYHLFTAIYPIALEELLRRFMVNRKVLLMCPKCYKIVHFAPLEETKKCENGHEVINFYNVPMKKE